MKRRIEWSTGDVAAHLALGVLLGSVYWLGWMLLGTAFIPGDVLPFLAPLFQILAIPAAGIASDHAWRVLEWLKSW